MEGQTTQPFLPAPSPSQQRLSFCDPTPKGLGRWLQTLPKANLGEMAKQVHKALLELNQLVTPVENRLSLLELLRTEVFYICQQLEPELLNQPLLLDKRAQQIARLCQSLQERLAAGYKLIIVEQAQAGNINRNLKVLRLALQRICHTLRTLLRRSCQLHQAPAGGLWLELHRMYQVACKFGLQQMPQSDPQSLLDEISIEQTWLTAVLLGCARTNQLHQASIEPLLAALETWVSRVKLQAAHAPGSLLVVSLKRDQPPCYRSLLAEGETAGLRGINVSALLATIKQQLAAAEPPAFSPALLQHLLKAFNDPAPRRWERRPAQGELTLCVGLRALHYFLAGERPFESLLGQRASKPALLSDDTAAQVDAWGGVIGGSEQLTDTSGAVAFTAKAADDEATEQHPLYQERLLNRSSGGYCLTWQAQGEAPLSIGELVGIREAGGQGFTIARVSWMMQKGQDIQVGVERIADSALPCALQLVRRGLFEQPFLRALLLPSGNGIVSPRLIAPRLPFKQGDQVRINTEGKERLALLEHWQAGSVNFNQFAYRLLGTGGAEPSLASGKMPAPDSASIEEDSFDSLWNSL